jgi:phosphoglycolate phosphatase
MGLLMNPSPQWMVLFDIDGTLLDTGGLGRMAFTRGLERVTGEPDDLSYLSFAGNTDRNVLDQVMAARGLRLADADIRRVFHCIAEELRALLQETPAREIAGAGAFVNRLEDMGAALGLVTGNIRECAYLKLGSVGLERFFGFGGFGDEHADRRIIARSALEAARAAGHDMATDRICLVGDTPFDVAAGKALGIPVLGVASGKFGAEALTESGASIVAEDLTDSERLMDWLAATLK